MDQSAMNPKGLIPDTLMVNISLCRDYNNLQAS